MSEKKLNWEGEAGLRLIDADDLAMETEKSMKNNPHKDNKIAQNHFTEHIHFLELINRQPTVIENSVMSAYFEL